MMTKTFIYNRKGAVPILIWIAIAVIGMAIAGGYISLATITGSDDKIYVTEYGRLECLKDQSVQTITKYADQNYAFECGGDYSVDKCDVYVSCSGTSFIAPSCFGGYGIGGGGTTKYNIQKNQRVLLTSLNKGEKIAFASAINGKYTKIEYQFYPFRLYTFESGKKSISSSSDCCLANQNELQKNSFKYGDWVCLEQSGSNQFKNYFLFWKEVTGAKLYDNQICLNNALYSVEKIKLADGTTKNLQGNKIKDVECCPHQSAQCSKDFKFTKADTKREVTCTYDYQCENSGDPILVSRTTAKYEKCVSGNCVSYDLKIECDSDAQCRSLKGEGYGCDLSNDNFGKCIEIGKIAQAKCGDGYCQIGETANNCVQDCERNCKEGDKLVTKEVKEGELCFMDMGICKKVVKRQCESEGLNWYKIILIFLVLAFVVMFRGQILSGIKYIFRRFI
jgi:hypothetical protein